ncbi:MAG TPA: hypothetical protein DCQ58_03440, partial [Saprospirales bacterium]|nr:hypothetical protein [Saprospirales bacterium]
LLLNIFSSQAQNIDSFFQKIHFLTEETPLVLYDFVDISGPMGLTEERFGYGKIRYMPLDSMLFYHNIVSFYKDIISQQIYTGGYVSIIDHKKSDVLMIQTDSFPFAYKIVQNVLSITPDFLYDKTFYLEFLDSDGIESYETGEENLFGKPHAFLKLVYGETEESRYDTTTYYFDKLTMLPVGYKMKFEYAGTEMEQVFLIHNLVILEPQETDWFDMGIFHEIGYKFKYASQIKRDQEKENAQAGQSEVEQADTTMEENSSIMPFDFDDYKGKKIVMDFWYIGCGPCLRLIPVMEKLHEEYPEVAFIGMNVRDEAERIAKFVEIKKIKYPVMRERFGFEQKYKMTGFPVILIFDEDGKLIRQLDGYSDGHDEEIREILGE